MYGFHTDNHKHMDKDNPQLKSTLKSYDKIAQGLTHDALYGKTIQDYRIEYFKNVITLLHLCSTAMLSQTMCLFPLLNFLILQTHTCL